MNIYVVVEGEKTEKLVYASWISLINPQLTQALRIGDVDHNRFFIEGGGGLPYLFEVIEGALENVATISPNGYPLFDRLVIVVDSEDMTLFDKNQEIQDFVNQKCAANAWVIDCRIIVQHFCFEAWALGNTRLFRGNIRDSRLMDYIAAYNVSLLDPELLPPKPSEELNRAWHAKKYLKMLFNEKFPKQGYSHTNPGPLCHPHYFWQIAQRRSTTGHVDSFGAVLTAFV
jgi:hypothetical protein